MRLNELPAWLRRQGGELLAIHDTPHAVAGGIALGLLVGFTPLLSIKTLLAIGLAALFRCNKIAAAIAVTLHDLSLPLSPFLIRLEYGMGYWMLSPSPRHWPPETHLHNFHLTEWLRWDVLVELIWPMFLGSLVVAIPIAVLSYFISLRMIIRFRAARAEREG